MGTIHPILSKKIMHCYYSTNMSDTKFQGEQDSIWYCRSKVCTSVTNMTFGTNFETPPETCVLFTRVHIASFVSRVACPRPNSIGEPGLKKIFKMPLTISVPVIQKISLWLLINIMYHVLLFAIAGLASTVLLNVPMSTNNILMTPKSMCYVNGSSTEVKPDGLSTRGPSFERSKGSAGKSHHQNGIK